MDFVLTSRGLANIDNSSMESFYFNFNGKRYQTTKLKADFFSPKISAIHKTDPFFNEFVLKYDYESFEDIKMLLNGHSIRIEPKNEGFLRYIATTLKNPELYKEIINLNHELTLENTIDLMLNKFNNDILFTDELEFIAKNISKIKRNNIMKLNSDLLQMIFASPSLAITDESWLYELIIEIISKKGENYRFLLESIVFDCLPKDKLSSYFLNLDFDHISNYFWETIKQSIHAHSQSSSIYRLSRIAPYSETFRYIPEKPFDGILTKFQDEENVYQITSSSIMKGSPDYLLFSNSGYYISEDKAKQWIMVDFNEQKICLTEYSIRSEGSSPGWYHLKNWNVEGSNDNENWIILDSHENNSDLNSNNAIKTFFVQNREFFRYIRLKQIGINHRKTNHLCMSAIELFGILSH